MHDEFITINVELINTSYVSTIVHSRESDKAVYSGSTVYLTEDGKFRTKRSRWKYVLIVVGLLCVAGLIVGLVIGLNKSSSSSSGDQSSQSGSEQTTKTSTSTATTSQKHSTTPETPTTTASPTTPGNVDWLKEPCSSSETSECPWSEESNPLLLISLDGFRADYLLRNLTPTIEKLRTCGVHTPYMRSVFPTLTFPNHYSIITGLYPESHGIVGNSMYDAQHNNTFSIRGDGKFESYWWGGEPIWSTAMKHGKRTASYFWVGSEMNISGQQPDIWFPYDGGVTYEQRVDTALDWLTMPTGERPDFMTLYFDEPDHTGHGSGPDSQEVNDMLERMDKIIRRLMDGLLSRKLEHCVNIVMIADHGMSPTSCERRVVLDKYEKAVNDMLVYSGTTGYIHTHYKQLDGAVLENEEVVATEEVVDSLTCKNSHLNVFSRKTTPIRHHYTNNDRIGEVLLDIEDTWLVSPTRTNFCLKGNHGYDNIYKSMQALFLAHGPDIAQNFESEPFENIELYNFMSDLLHIQPAPNNGTVGTLYHLLRNPPTSPTDIGKNLEVCMKSGNTPPNTCNCNNTLSYNPPSSSSINVFPYGIPLSEGMTSGCILHGNQFSSIFNTLYKVPMLTSFPLTAEQVQEYTPDTEECYISDTRLDDDDIHDCMKYNNIDTGIDDVRLFDPGFSIDEKTESRISTNKVPMLTGFRDGIWSYAWRLVKEYAVKYNLVHVSVGPVYDYNFDGLADEHLYNLTQYVNDKSNVPVPTHYYMMLVKCSHDNADLSACPPTYIDILSFVLPHENNTNNCLTNKDFLKNNVVRIRDIELLTGLRFLPEYDFTAGARLRTWLEISLWPTSLVTPWTELPCSTSEPTCPPGPPPLLLLSLDGFRADYLSRNLTPTIQRLANCGVHTPYMRAVYPTVTFPNHYTIVTGLYPESHGVISNKMFDEEIGEIFTLGGPTSKDPRWWKGEPIWHTAMKQGLKTATYFWPGSDVNISGSYPDIYKPYDGAAGYSQRVYDVLDWLTMPEETRPDFITLYFDEPDHAGHNSGPDSEEVDGQLETVDELINILMSNLYEKGLQNCVNMIILADHGMSEQSCSRKISLKDFYPNITKMIAFERVFGNILPQFGSDKQTLNESYNVDGIVDSLMCRHSAMKVFTKSTMPRRHHFMNSDRIGDIVLDMKDGWLVVRNSTNWCSGGNHGWDNTYKNMHALFLANGPAFKQNLTAEPFENIELYNLMTEIMNITGAENNGTYGSLHYMLKNDGTIPTETGRVVLDACSFNITSVPSPHTCGCNNDNVLNNDIYLTEDNKYLMFGLPSMENNVDMCLLYQNRVTVAYSNYFNSPQMISTVIQNETVYDADDFTTNIERCLVNDTRITSEHCTIVSMDNNLKLLPLFPKNSMVKDTGYLTSTVLPLYTGFYTGVWKYMFTLLQDYTNLYGNVSITSGPIYDYNNDGLYEDLNNKTRYFDTENTIPVPTHIYTILIKCREKGDNLPCYGDFDILSFILPNLQQIPNCLKQDVYLKDNVARIRDIELLTGLQFMTSYDVAKAAILRTFLPENLWESSMPKSWTELEYPSENACTSDYQPILLISLGGFRADYLNRNVTPTISRLRDWGVKSPYMRPVFPTNTYPNHQSIVTGLYPESHGIIHDDMFDPKIGQFSKSKKDSRWWGGEPIWKTAKKQGLKTASYMWPGSDINGSYPDYWYDTSQGPSSYGIQQVLNWMTMSPDERPEFISLYFDLLDTTGKKEGPSDHAAIDQSLISIDNILHDLMDLLFQQDLHFCTNIVIVSDHGMADVSCHRIVRLKYDVDYDYLSANFFVWEGSFGRIANTYKYNSTIRGIAVADEPAPYDGLYTNLTCANKHLNVYDKTQFPVRLHYSNNVRIDEMLLDVQPEYFVTRSWASSCWGGRSGYDNIHETMEALFLAVGPAFKVSTTVEPFENIELYNLFADILNITAATNNGTLGSLNHLLKSPNHLIVPDVHEDLPVSTFLYNAEEYVTTVQSNDCRNSCHLLSGQEISNFYNVLQNSNITGVPHGTPYISSNYLSSDTIMLLSYPDHLIAYDILLQLPRWISTTFSEPMNENIVPNCVMIDPRLNATIQDICVRKNMSIHLSLIDDVIVKLPEKKVIMAPSLVRMKETFYKNVWEAVKEKLRSMYTDHTDINILSGPIFDNNHDGLPDNTNISSETIPSHYFIVIQTCEDVNIQVDKCINIIFTSYIIPHDERLEICQHQSIEQFMDKNQVRIRDIELITGFNVFSDISSDIAVKYRTHLPVSYIVT
ncbi:ectonucleotide pyrophosphatase phosphodiesterase [Mactra antiquata]